MPATEFGTGFFVNLVNVLVEVTGTGVENIWFAGRKSAGAGFKPVVSCAVRSVPSALKFRFEAYTSVCGDSELS
jgi:hypothetical protein